jgi:hypothetical protein
MVPFEEAFEIVLDSAYMLGTERVDITSAEKTLAMSLR